MNSIEKARFVLQHQSYEGLIRDTPRNRLALVLFFDDLESGPEVAVRSCIRWAVESADAVVENLKPQRSKETQ